jgi:hypothetical protein
MHEVEEGMRYVGWCVRLCRRATLGGCVVQADEQVRLLLEAEELMMTR